MGASAIGKTGGVAGAGMAGTAETDADLYESSDEHEAHLEATFVGIEFPKLTFICS